MCATCICLVMVKPTLANLGRRRAVAPLRRCSAILWDYMQVWIRASEATAGWAPTAPNIARCAEGSSSEGKKKFQTAKTLKTSKNTKTKRWKYEKSVQSHWLLFFTDFLGGEKKGKKLSRALDSRGPGLTGNESCALARDGKQRHSFLIKSP